jgi:PhzF family phenazine biosynthesis protein
VTGLSIYAPYTTGTTAVEVRSFAPSCGVDEDPVCGSGNGSIAAFRRARGLLANGESGYLSAQGQCVGRDGRISIQYVANDQIIIGGACVTSVDGTMRC